MFSPSHSPGSMYMFQYCQLLSLTFWMPLYLSSWVYIMDEKKDQNCLCPARYGSSQSCDIAKICQKSFNIAYMPTCQNIPGGFCMLRNFTELKICGIFIVMLDYSTKFYIDTCIFIAYFFHIMAHAEINKKYTHYAIYATIHNHMWWKKTQN